MNYINNTFGELSLSRLEDVNNHRSAIFIKVFVITLRPQHNSLSKGVDMAHKLYILTIVDLKITRRCMKGDGLTPKPLSNNNMAKGMLGTA